MRVGSEHGGDERESEVAHLVRLRVGVRVGVRVRVRVRVRVSPNPNYARVASCAGPLR